MNQHPSHHELDDELLSAYLDNELSAEERAAVEHRLAEDPAARRLLEELRHVSQTVRALPQQPLGRDLRDSVLKRIEARQPSALPGDDLRTAAATTDPASGDGAIPTFSIGRSRRGWFWASLAVAAALVIMFLQPDQPADDDLPPVARNDRGPALLSRPPDAATPEPAPAASSLATAPQDAKRQGMSTRGGDSAAGKAPSRSAAPAADRFAVTLQEQPADELALEPTLVVHVLAKREALEQGAFDRLLLSNGIAVEPHAPQDSTSLPTASARSLNASGRIVEQPAGASAEAADVEAVLVEAPPNVILSCLAELNQDDSNFLGVSVEEPAAEEQAASTAAPAASNQKLAVNLNQFNRGIVPQQQKALLTGDKSYFSKQTPEVKLRPSFQGGARGYADVSQQRANLQTADEARTAKEAYSRGRAKRVQLPDVDGGQVETRRESRGNARFPMDADNQQLQVLFVLGVNGQAPATAPAASAPTATPTQQPE